MEFEEPGKAIPFIHVDVDGLFEVSNEAMTLLDRWNPDKKIAVICIAGPYRSGKSFLANRILHQNSGFSVGSTTMACTKGIWMWNKPVPISSKVDAILLDTEGLGSTERSTNVDIKIFSLSILLSSLFIYNCIGTISEYTLDDISLVCNLTEHIHVNKSKMESGTDFYHFFPSFMWVLRDFYHVLDPGYTPRDYMESWLEQVPGITEDIIKKNKIREGITKYFKDRDWYTLIRPLNEEERLAHIESESFTNLKPEFQAQMNALISKIYSKAKPKIINSKSLNSSMFLGLSLEYIEAINSETTPTMVTALDRVVYAESNKIMDSIFEEFKAEISTRWDRKKFPIEKEDLDEILKRIKESFLEKIQLKLANILEVDDIIKNVYGFLDKFRYISEEKNNENYTDSFLYNSSIIKNLMKWVPFDQLLKMHDLDDDNQSSSSVMINNFCDAMAKIIDKYHKNSKGPAKFDTLSEFIIESNFVDEAKLVNAGEKIDFKNQKKFFSYILAFTQNLIEVYFAEQTQKMKEKHNEAASIDRQQNEHHAKLKKKLENIKRETDKIRSEKSELEISLDRYERK